MITYLQNGSDLEKLIKESSTLLVDFYADWCGPCQMLMEVLEQLNEEEKDITILKINADKFENICLQYKVYSIPALFLYKNGNLVGSELGFMPLPKLKSFISK